MQPAFRDICLIFGGVICVLIIGSLVTSNNYGPTFSPAPLSENPVRQVAPARELDLDSLEAAFVESDLRYLGNRYPNSTEEEILTTAYATAKLINEDLGTNLDYLDVLTAMAMVDEELVGHSIIVAGAYVLTQHQYAFNNLDDEIQPKRPEKSDADSPAGISSKAALERIRLSKAVLDRLFVGQTLQEIQDLIGSKGILSRAIGSKQDRVEVYEWKLPDDSTLEATFIGGRLESSELD